MMKNIFSLKYKIKTTTQIVEIVLQTPRPYQFAYRQIKVFLYLNLLELQDTAENVLVSTGTVCRNISSF